MSVHLLPVPVTLCVCTKVGAGIFKELDFRQEAAHINLFKQLYQQDLDELGVIVPNVVGELSGPLVLVTDWIEVCVCVCVRERERE